VSASAAFYVALEEAAREGLDVARAGTSEWIEGAWQQARKAWPGVELPAAAFGDRVGKAVCLLPRPAEYEHLHTSDLYLACGCAIGNARAMDWFERVHIPALVRALSRMGFDDTQRGEVESKVREQLFVEQPSGAPPLLSAYAGRGSLRSWVQSIGIHAALKGRRGRNTIPIEDLPTELPARGLDPELDYLGRFYRTEFQACLGRAMAGLTKRQRNVLRQHYLDGLSLEALARAYRVHRATAARWLAAARDETLSRTKEELVAALRLAESEVESVIRLMRARSSLEANVSAVLRAASRRTQR
jgi:RNA polymerase sigma-70 factor (ECF subfamily)